MKRTFVKQPVSASKYDEVVSHDDIKQDILLALDYAYEQASTSHIPVIYDSINSDEDYKDQLNRLRDAQEYVKSNM